jgi:hypothetical protein
VILAVLTPVTKPLPFTVTTGIAVELPNEPTLEFTVSKVVVRVMLPVPSKFVALASTSPSIVMLLAVCNAVAVDALPVTAPVCVPAVLPVTLPVTLPVIWPVTPRVPPMVLLPVTPRVPPTVALFVTAALG